MKKKNDYDEGIEGEQLHCVRCHYIFDPNDKEDKCIVEHDMELFEGSRSGTSWYTGKLGCCGADYRFHRHHCEEETKSSHCFMGNHTTNPQDVQYHISTMKICDLKDCGKELHEMTQKAYEQQLQVQNKKREAEIAKLKAEQDTKRVQIQTLQSQGKRREARKLRAEMLGRHDLLEEKDDLNSDLDSMGCEEFDHASDCELSAPWGNVMY